MLVHSQLSLHVACERFLQSIGPLQLEIFWLAIVAKSNELAGGLILFFEALVEALSFVVKLWFWYPIWLWYKHFSDVIAPISFEEFVVCVVGVCLPIFALALATI